MAPSNPTQPGQEPKQTNIIIPKANILTKLSIRLIYKLLSQPWIQKHRKDPGSIIFVSSKLCIKATPFTRLSKAQAMVFIAQNTTIPVPRVYAAFEHKGRTFILMERIHGVPLASGWVARSAGSRVEVLRQLKGFVEEMRNLRPLGLERGQKRFTVVADVFGEGPIYDPRLPGRSFWGRFGTVKEFHENLLGGKDLQGYSEGQLGRFEGMRELKRFYCEERNWDRAETVFTHGNLSSLNILARGDEVVGIVDWETAGWYPRYWEFTSAWHVNPQNLFWREEERNFVEVDERALEVEIVRRRWFGDY